MRLTIAEIERTLLAAEDFYEEHVVQRAGDMGRIRFFRQLAQHEFYDRLPSFLHLRTMTVSPPYQRQGIGGKMLRWGLDHAERERIPVTLEASVAGQSLYEKFGFKTVARSRIREDLEGVAMLWEPGPLHGRWLEESEAGEWTVRERPADVRPGV